MFRPNKSENFTMLKKSKFSLLKNKVFFLICVFICTQIIFSGYFLSLIPDNFPLSKNVDI